MRKGAGMKWTKKREHFSSSYELHGRRNGYKATVSYNSFYNYYYFLIKNGDRVYNSLWDEKSYTNEEECKRECENFCNKDVLKERE